MQCHQLEAFAMKVSVCVVTHRRVERLHAVLQDLARQRRLPEQVVVVDIDAAGSARPVIGQLRTSTAPLRSGASLAFIDDDERAPGSWLGQLLDAATLYRAGWRYRAYA